jgi:hypothetical protein
VDSALAVQSEKTLERMRSMPSLILGVKAWGVVGVASATGMSVSPQAFSTQRV